ncbi:VOC family protein [Herbiconiux sp. L3-i23]|uniref:VOC family protein n=1 Tax=Herbiconiux sp. L3-i23 TaxID=2905871 RepID=UPI00205D1F40|nr:VOC family protein [Herbiconiux sp. L3-i23]BDI22714.1 putative 3-demethylubiquinone-9 3-methyltransferase [Herbiconiux sp. L3-i23]
MNKVTPFLWFDDQLPEAMRFYTSVFPDSEILDDDEFGPTRVVRFRIAGQEIRAMNAGPHFVLNEAFSLFVDCADQAEVDRYWDALLEGGGEESQCGWLKDRFGVSWQIVPRRLMELQTDPDPGRARRAMEAMLTMRKIDIAALERAADAA